jgi:hypothetical protein
MGTFGNLIFAFCCIYAVVFVFVAMGSRNFFSGRTIVANPGVISLIITTILFLILLVSAVVH